MTKISVLHEKYMEDPEYREEYKKAAAEFALPEILLKARTKAKMSQVQVAEKLQTSQAAIARLEGGKVSPSIATLQRYAKAVGAELKISFVSSRKSA